MKAERIGGRVRGLSGMHVLWGHAAFAFYTANGRMMVPRVGSAIWGISLVLSVLAGACGQMSNERAP